MRQKVCRSRLHLLDTARTATTEQEIFSQVLPDLARFEEWCKDPRIVKEARELVQERQKTVYMSHLWFAPQAYPPSSHFSLSSLLLLIFLFFLLSSLLAFFSSCFFLFFLSSLLSSHLFFLSSFLPFFSSSFLLFSSAPVASHPLGFILHFASQMRIAYFSSCRWSSPFFCLQFHSWGEGGARSSIFRHT